MAMSPVVAVMMMMMVVWLIDCALFLTQCFTNSSGVGRRKSWWSTVEMGRWRTGSRVSSTERPASLRKWCIWWTRNHQRLQISLWPPTRPGICRMWTWRLGCSDYPSSLERHQIADMLILGAGTLHRCSVLLITLIGDSFSIKFSIPFTFLKKSVPIYENSIAFWNEGPKNTPLRIWLFQFLPRGLAFPGYAPDGFYQIHILGSYWTLSLP